jgi:hypothetical protein
LQAIARLALLGLLLPFGVAAEDDPRTAGQIIECVRANQPQTNAVQTIELTRWDRTGVEHITRAVVFRGQIEGELTLLMRFTHPQDLAESLFMITQRQGRNEFFLSSPDLPGLKQISGPSVSGELFGTDFSYQDIERIYGMNRPGQWSRLTDGTEEGRPTWVIETRPSQGPDASYGRVVSYVDQETCVVLRSEIYDRTLQLRKIFTALPAEVRKKDEVWLAHNLLMSDLRDETQTRIVVESVEDHAPIPDLPRTVRDRLGLEK